MRYRIGNPYRMIIACKNPVSHRYRMHSTCSTWTTYNFTERGSFTTPRTAQIALFELFDSGLLLGYAMSYSSCDVCDLCDACDIYAIWKFHAISHDYAIMYTSGFFQLLCLPKDFSKVREKLLFASRFKRGT